MANPLADDLEQVLEHTRPLWEELRGQRLFLTGGTGFFGCWLLESFRWANARLGLGARAMVLTRSPRAFRAKAPHLADDKGVELLAGDVRNFSCPSGEFTHVIHAATDSAVVPSENEVVETILQGTERCLEFATQAKTRKFLFTSSGAVYGKQPPEMSHVAEEYVGETGSLTAYGLAKRKAEALISSRPTGDEMESKIARCFAFVGPYLNLDVHFAVGNFLRDQMRGGPIVVKGDGTAMRSYFYASDLAIWLWTMLFRAPSGRAYNVGSEDAVSIAELAKAVAGLSEPPAEVKIAGKPTGVPAARYVPSTARARRELGLVQRVGLQDALEKTRSWFER